MRLLTLKIDVRKALRETEVMGRRERAHFRNSIIKTRGRLAQEIKQKGDAKIRSSGNFSERWPRAFEVQESESTRLISRITIGFNSSIPYASVHEFGAKIRGKPWLWIPLSWANLKGVWPSSYPGQLFALFRRGKKPLLFDRNTKEAKYVGVKFVRIFPRFGLRYMASNILRARVRTFYDFWTTGGR